MTEKTIHERLSEIQKTLKVGKEHNNTFGKYKYRKAEDILNEVKKLLDSDEYITTSVNIEAIQDRFYVVIKACFHKNTNEIMACGYARESFDKKGMDDAQLTGATTSYAKKYALCNLFAIDDEVDADDDNYKKYNNNQSSTPQKPVEKKQEPQKPAEAFSYEKLKEELMECGTLAEVQTVREKASNNKSKMSIEQQKEFRTLLTNTLNAIKEMENAK